MSALSPKSSSSIQVVVRLRPMNEQEKKHDTLPVVTASTTDKSVTVIKGSGARQVRSQFHFDQVFTSFSTQEEVFEDTLKPVIGDVLRGYESTVFAYGQTGTGKTHTMEGDLSSPEMHGVIPRSAQSIFEALKKAKYSDHSVTCSYLEIYNEDLCDLLSDEKQQVGDKRSAQGLTKLEIMDGKNGTFCRGLSQKVVNSAEDVLALMHQAQQKRKIGETKMNKASSRSHSIFTMNIKAKATLINEGSTMEFVGKLHMVDLAGSECAKTAGLGKASGAEAARERERMNINRSLLTLGRVISMLKEQSESKKGNHVRIPYRDSKLTRILQESLGGRCKTVIVATLSPSVTAIEESISTLNYAQSANGIINKPVSTSYMSIGPTAASVGIQPSSSDMSASEQGNSVEHWHQMECRLQYMQAQVEEAQAALARKHMQQQELVDKAEKAECERHEMEKKYYDASIRNNALKEELAAEVEKRRGVESQLRGTQIALKKTSAILSATQQTEASLNAEATSLLKVLKSSISDGDELHRIIVEQHKSETQRREATRNFHAASLAVLQETIGSLATISKEADEYRSLILTAAKDAHEKDHSSLTATAALLKAIAQNVQKLTSAMKAQVVDDGGIVQTLKSTSSSVESGIDELLKVVSDSEEALLSSCRSAHEQLEEYAGHLKELATTHSTISKESISALDNNISTSKDRIKKIIDAATNALATARNDRVTRMSAHSAIIAEWRGSSVDATMKVKDTAESKSAFLGKTIDFFSSEMHHHNDMESALASQRSFLEDKGNAHVGLTFEQQAALSKQAEMLVMARKRQQQVREEVARNIMSGVQELVNKQVMDMLGHEEEAHMESLSKINCGLVESNKTIQLSAKEIKDVVEQTNAELQEGSTAVHQNDIQVREAMEEIKKSLQGIAASSNEHQLSTVSFSMKAEESVEQLASLDKDAEGMLEHMKSNGDDCTAHITGTVLKQTKDGILRLTRSGLEVASYSVGKVIPKSTAALDALEEPRKEFIESINNGTKQIGDSLSSGCKMIESVAHKQSEIASNLCQVVESEEKQFSNNTAVSHRAEIDSRKDDLIKHATGHGDNTKAKLSACASKATSMKDRIDGFTSDVIHAGEEVPSVADRNTFQYCEHFTATPSEDAILKDIDLGVVDKLPPVEENHVPSEDGGSNDGNDKFSRNSDACSVRSIGSGTSVASPVSRPENNDPQVLFSSNSSVASASKSIASRSSVASAPKGTVTCASKNMSSSKKPRRPLRVRVANTPTGRNRKKPRVSGTPQRGTVKHKIRRNSNNTRG